MFGQCVGLPVASEIRQACQPHGCHDIPCQARVNPSHPLKLLAGLGLVRKADHIVLEVELDGFIEGGSTDFLG